jgi:hypothetical protein
VPERTRTHGARPFDLQWNAGQCYTDLGRVQGELPPSIYYLPVVLYVGTKELVPGPMLLWTGFGMPIPCIYIYIYIYYVV